jgi:hypothetical protein
LIWTTVARMGAGNRPFSFKFQVFSFLHKVEARLFVMHQFKNIDIQGQLVASKESVPSLRFSGFGLWHGQLFAFSHHQHLHRDECKMREKVQLVREWLKNGKNWPVSCYLGCLIV